MQGLSRNLALVVVFFTGFSGLVYEVIWHKYLVNLLGSQAQATATILAVFLGGLACGYYLFGKFCNGRSPGQLVRAFGYCEVGIGLWAVIFHELYSAFWSAVGVQIGSATWILDTLTAILLMLVPTTLMGGTLPLLTQGLSKNLRDAGPFHARVYGVNTAGAFLGCLAAGFWIIPTYGLPLSLYGMAVINLCAGFLMVWYGRHAFADTLDKSEVTKSERSGWAASWPTLAIAFAAGFYGLAIQTVLVRLVGISMGSTEYAFSMVVSLYILMLALGALALGGKAEKVSAKKIRINQFVIMASLLVLYFTVTYWSYWLHLVRVGFGSNEVGFYFYHFATLLGLGVLLLIPIGFMGRTMPLLFGYIRSQFGQIGNQVGQLYTANTIGCVTGALLGGYLAFKWFNLDQVFLFSVAFTGLSIFLLPWKVWKFSSRATLFVGGLVAFGLCLVLPGWEKKYLSQGLFRYKSIQEMSFVGRDAMYKTMDAEHVFYEDGPTTSVAVKEYRRPGGRAERAIFVNGKSDGMTGSADTKTMKILGHLPSLLHPGVNDRAAIIGFGTGMSAGIVSLYPEVKQIDVIEISEAIQKAAPYFDFATYNITKNPRMNWILSDAYRHLSGTDEKYAMILSEPSNPWISGIEKLYALEFYQKVYQSIREDGIYAQWFHTYDASPETVGLIFNTIGQVFPHTRTFNGSPVDLIILASKQPLKDLDWSLFESRFNKEVQADLKSMDIDGIGDLLAHEVWLGPERFSESATHTLEFPKLSYRAGKDFYMGKSADSDQMSGSARGRYFARVRAKDSLLADWKKAQADPSSWEPVVKKLCGKAPGDFSALYRSSVRCQYLQASGLDRSALIPKRLQAAVNYVSGQSPKLSHKLSGRDVGHLAKVYKVFDNPWQPFDPKRFIRVSEPCLRESTTEALHCSMGVLEALASSSKPVMAFDIIPGIIERNKVAPTLPPNKIKRFAEKVLAPNAEHYQAHH